MKVKEIVDVLVSPYSFRNIDFSRKGIYTVSFKVCIADKATDKKVYAYPILLEESTNEEFFKSVILTENNQFRSKSFYISFNDECIMFDTSCLFRIELDRNRHQDLILQCQLLHIDISHNDIEHFQTIQNKDYISKANKKILLNRKEKSEVEYTGELIFETMDYFSVLEVLVETRSLDYRFRSHDYQLSEYATLNETIKQKQNLGKQLFQYLGAGEIGKFLIQQYEDLSTEQFYEKFILSQVQNYSQLLEKYQDLVQKIVGTPMPDMTMSDLNKMQYSPKELNYLYQNIEGSEQEIVYFLIEKYEVRSKEELYEYILCESNRIGKNIRFLWRLYAQLLNKNLKRRYLQLKGSTQAVLFEQKLKKFFRPYKHDRAQSIQEYKEVRFKQGGFISNGIHYPLIFCDNLPHNHKKSQGQVLNVFVHGFQGSELDLEMMKNYINIFHKETTNLLCHTLQNETEENIELLGLKFSSEVIRFVQRSSFQFKRINFIGYSLGGIIIRAGLRHLHKFRDKFNLLITLASPHLGISEMDNALVSAGIWYMIKFDKVKSMAELGLKDTQNLMLKLSQEESLKWLKKIIVVSSKEDGFVPNYSARLDAQDKPEIVRQIYRNILARVKQVIRVEVWFDAQSGTIDRILGRKSHIQFLQSQGFSEIFFSVFGTLF